MCNPVAIGIAGIAMSGATTAISYSNQASAARAQRRYGEAVYDQELGFREEQNIFQLERYLDNAERATSEVKRNYSQLDQRIGQEAQVAAMEINKYMSQSRALQSTSTASDAERQVMGPTADYIMDAVQGQALRSIENVRREQEWRLDSMMQMKDEVEAQGIARIESMNPQPIPLPNLPPPVQQPDLAAAIMGFGASALMSYASLLQNQSAPNTTTATTATATGGSAAARSMQMPGRFNVYNSSGMSMGSYGPFGGMQNYSIQHSWVG